MKFLLVVISALFFLSSFSTADDFLPFDSLEYATGYFDMLTYKENQKNIPPVLFPKSFDFTKEYRFTSRFYTLLSYITMRAGAFNKEDTYLQEKNPNWASNKVISDSVTIKINREKIDTLNKHFSFNLPYNLDNVELGRDNEDLFPDDYYSFLGEDKKTSINLKRDSIVYYWDPAYWRYSVSMLKASHLFREKLREMVKEEVIPFCVENIDFEVASIDIRRVDFVQTYKGIRLYDSSFWLSHRIKDSLLTEYRLSKGRLSLYKEIEIDDFEPKYSPEQIRRFIQVDLMDLPDYVERIEYREPSLVIIGKDVLAYKVEMLLLDRSRIDEDLINVNAEIWKYYIDAHTAKLHERTREKDGNKVSDKRLIKYVWR